MTNVVSTNTDKEDGPIRLGYQITLRQPKITPIEISATRYITILCPFENDTEREELKVDAKFTDMKMERLERSIQKGYLFKSQSKVQCTIFLQNKSNNHII